MDHLNHREFEAVYRQHAALVYRYLLRLGCSPQDAEDITQDTFVKALLNIDGFRGTCKLSAWLCQIAKNTWLTQLKKHKRNFPLPDTEDAVTDNYLYEWVDLTERLEEPYRSVFLKVALGGWTYEEISLQYKKSESWVRVTYYRARSKLQQMLTERRT